MASDFIKIGRAVEFEHSYLMDSIRIIQYVCLVHGYDVTLSQAREVWEEYSSEECDCGFVCIPTYICGLDVDMESTWDAIKNYFIEHDDYVDDKMLNYVINSSDQSWIVEFCIKNRNESDYDATRIKRLKEGD